MKQGAGWSICQCDVCIGWLKCTVASGLLMKQLGKDVAQGLIAGYFDNMAVYRKVGPRLKAHQQLKLYLGQERLYKFAEYVERNLGALAGNFIFGKPLFFKP